jgi:hypothetical protein
MRAAVDGIGEINGGGTARQREDLALGREHVDRIREQVHLDVIPELRRIACFVLDVEQRLQPLRAQPLGHRAVRLLCLVKPVGSHTRLGHDVHLFGTHLEFDVQPRRPHERGVQ